MTIVFTTLFIEEAIQYVNNRTAENLIIEKDIAPVSSTCLTLGRQPTTHNPGAPNREPLFLCPTSDATSAAGTNTDATTDPTRPTTPGSPCPPTPTDANRR